MKATQAYQRTLIKLQQNTQQKGRTLTTRKRKRHQQRFKPHTKSFECAAAN